MITPCKSQPGSICQVEYPIFYLSVRITCLKLSGEPFCLTMCYFLLVSYLLVQCIQYILPKNINLHVVFKGVHPAGISSASADKLYEHNPSTTCSSVDGLYYDTAVWDLASTFLFLNPATTRLVYSLICPGTSKTCNEQALL